MAHPESNHDCLPGIACEVTNCVYNNKQQSCTAEEIKVGPHYAVSHTDTACNTFKQDKHA